MPERSRGEIYRQLIDNCGNRLRGNAIDGNGRMIQMPLLSIFFGQEAERNIPVVMDTYNAYWVDARHLLTLGQWDYNPAEVERRCNIMSGNPNRLFQEYNHLLLAYFWDIMDDTFETAFQMAQDTLPFSVMTRYDCLYFIFCKDSTASYRQIKKDRLNRVMDWAAATNRHLLILSDSTDQGILNEETYPENYRICANILTIIDSVYYTDAMRRETQLGPELLMNLQRAPYYSASFYSIEKNTHDIACVTLDTMLTEYKNIARRSNSIQNVRERLCGVGKDYPDLFDEFFQENLLRFLHADVSFLRTMPWTPAMEKLEQSIINPRRSWGRSLNPAECAEDAVMSLSGSQDSGPGIWDLVYDRYYGSALREWQRQEEGLTIQSFFEQKLNSRLSYIEQRDMLGPEIERLERQGDDLIRNYRMADPVDPGSMKLEDWLDDCAVAQMKRELHPTLLENLIQAMRNMALKSKDFEDVLQEADRNVPGERAEESIRTAYSHYAKELFGQHPEVLTDNIRPCDPDELPAELDKAFTQLIQADAAGAKIYTASLEKDLAFQIERGGVQASRDTIYACFRQNLEEMRRLRTLHTPSDTMLYSMVNENAAFLNDLRQDQFGMVFRSARADVIERLMIYPVNRGDIVLE